MNLFSSRWDLYYYFCHQTIFLSWRYLCESTACDEPTENYYQTLQNDRVTGYFLFCSFYLSLFFQLNADWTMSERYMNRDGWKTLYVPVSLTSTLIAHSIALTEGCKLTCSPMCPSQPIDTGVVKHLWLMQSDLTWQWMPIEPMGSGRMALCYGVFLPPSGQESLNSALID